MLYETQEPKVTIKVKMPLSDYFPSQRSVKMKHTSQKGEYKDTRGYSSVGADFLSIK